MPYDRAAIGSQCAYQINRTAFATYRCLIFGHQSAINTVDVRDSLLRYGEEAGIDGLKLAACIDSNASLPRVEENVREAQKLGVSSTPTSLTAK